MHAGVYVVMLRQVGQTIISMYYMNCLDIWLQFHMLLTMSKQSQIAKPTGFGVLLSVECSVGKSRWLSHGLCYGELFTIYNNAHTNYFQ